MVALHHDMIKPREIREKLRGNVPPALGKILVKMAEDAIQTRMQIAELVQHVAKQSSIIKDIVSGLSMMQSAIEGDVEEAVKSHGLPEGMSSEDPT